jgi:hypothetical protein
MMNTQLYASLNPNFDISFVNVSTQVQKLVEGTEYVFRVSAINVEGTSKPLESDAIMAKSPFGKFSKWHADSFQMLIIFMKLGFLNKH